MAISVLQPDHHNLKLHERTVINKALEFRFDLSGHIAKQSMLPGRRAPIIGRRIALVIVSLYGVDAA